MAQGDGQQIEWLEELVEVLRSIHNRVIVESGGVFGEHTALLYCAAARPFQSAFGRPIYPSAMARIAALFHAIIADHAFSDGNKRTASVFALFGLGPKVTTSR